MRSSTEPSTARCSPQADAELARDGQAGEVVVAVTMTERIPQHSNRQPSA
jgi:hypothetical protein